MSSYGSPSRITIDGISFALAVPRLGDCALDYGVGFVNSPAVLGGDGAFAAHFPNEQIPTVGGGGASAGTIASVLVSGLLGCDGGALGTITIDRNNGCPSETFGWDAPLTGAVLDACTG